MVRIFCALVLAASCSGEALCSQRFVATTGNDSSKGTFSNPWRTIQHAANVAAPNDTVFIRGGTYWEAISVNVSGSDTAGYITFMPFGSDSVFISGDSTSLPDIIQIVDREYLRFIGLRMGNLALHDTTNIFTGGAGIRVRGNSRHITLANNTISNISGILPQGIALFGDSDPLRFIRVVGNTIHSLTTDTTNGSYGGSGIRIDGAADSILIRFNTIHNIRARYDSLGGAMGITLYGTRADEPIRRVLIEGNILHDCQPAQSEALTLSGNIEEFSVLHNTVYQMNNIGIATGGGYKICPNPAFDVPRNGVIRSNRVYGCHTRFEDGYAAGIYVDGAHNILVEGNLSLSNDIGIAVNAEQVDQLCDSITIRNNMTWGNERSGVSIGADGISVLENGRLDTSGVVQYCAVRNNTIFKNNRRRVGQGELSIEDSLFHCTIVGNIFYSETDTLVLSTSHVTEQDFRMDYNVWFTPSGSDSAVFRMNGYEGPDYISFAEYRDSTGMEALSFFSDPRFIDTTLIAPDLHLRPTSPALNAGDSNYIPAPDELDIDLENRLVEQRIDIGADEHQGTLGVGERHSDGAAAFRLEQNTPNPFNPTTHFGFRIANFGFVTLKVYDLLGREVAALVQEHLAAGGYAATFNASGLASGVYFYRLTAGSFTETKRMLLLK